MESFGTNFNNADFLGSEQFIDFNSKQSKLKSHFLNRKNSSQWKIEIVWKNVAIFVIIHSIALYALFLILTFRVRLITIIFAYAYLAFSLLGVTGGSHRLWSHRSYKANLPLRILLMIAQTAAVQNDIFVWARDHRMHHKYTDTDADPHNSNRGFFFSHMGWLMCKKHPELIAKGKNIDMSDIASDPVVQFQRKYYVPLVLLLNLAIPTFIPWYFFGETFWTSYAMCVGRYVVSVNGTWLVNSAAHMWGTKPYDSNINPTESGLVIGLGFGEGFHNYHHTFPYDYKAGELGNYRNNFTACLIDFMAKIGWATNLKTASPDMIRKRALRTGDDSWKGAQKNENNNDNDCN